MKYKFLDLIPITGISHNQEIKNRNRGLKTLNREHCLIIVPGLGDKISLIEQPLRDWPKRGVKPFIHQAPWSQSEESLDLKLKRLVGELDRWNDEGYSVSLLGISAGSSLVLNAFAQRKKIVNKIISVCGRLRPGNNITYSLYKWDQKSRAFCDSVYFADKNQKAFSESDLQKFTTFNALFDELVPRKTSILPNAKNLTVPMVGHVFSIAYVMYIMREQILDVVNE